MRSACLLMLAVMAPAAACAPAAAWGADESGGTTSPFALGAGGRSIAMGGAAAAVWGESYAFLWNPAGLAASERGEVSLFRTSFFDDASTYSSAFASYPFLELGSIALGAMQLRVGDIERRDASNIATGGDLTSVETRYVFGYARNITRGFAAGVSAKFDRASIDSYVGNGIGFDLGIGLDTPVRSPVLDGVAFGLSLSNLIEPTVRLVNEEAGDPRGLRAGVALRRSIAGAGRDRLICAVDVEKTRYADPRVHAGAEYEIRDMVALRGGWGGSPSFGCGIRTAWVLVDYAYRSTDLGGNHLFSLTCRFGSSRSERAAAAERRRDESMRKALEARFASFETDFVKTSLAEAAAALDRKDYAAALDRYRRVLLWAPANEEAKQGAALAEASALVVRGDSLLNAGNPAEALFLYRGALRSMASPVIEERIALCEQRIQDASGQQRMEDDLLKRALELYTDRRWQDAAAAFEEVLDINPRSELAANYLKKARERLQELYDRAVADAERLAAQGRFAAAIEALRAQLERSPGDAALQVRIEELGRLQREAESRAAKTAAAKSEARRPTAEELQSLRAPYQRGIDYFTSGDFAKAIEEWEKVWRSWHEYEQVAAYLVKAYLYSGMELYAQHRYEDALETWNRILPIDPNNEKALRYIGKTKEELSRLEGLSRTP